MKITTNSIGNYGPAYVGNTASSTAAKKASTPDVTLEEKKFFAEMYPAKQDEIMSYEFYNTKGRITGVTVGSIIDRRG